MSENRGHLENIWRDTIFKIVLFTVRLCLLRVLLRCFDAMDLYKRVSLWSVEDVLEWVQEQHPALMNTLQMAIIKHAISGTTQALNSARFIRTSIR